MSLLALRLFRSWTVLGHKSSPMNWQSSGGHNPRPLFFDLINNLERMHTLQLSFLGIRIDFELTDSIQDHFILTHMISNVLSVDGGWAEIGRSSTRWLSFLSTCGFIYCTRIVFFCRRELTLELFGGFVLLLCSSCLGKSCGVLV